MSTLEVKIDVHDVCPKFSNNCSSQYKFKINAKIAFDTDLF